MPSPTCSAIVAAAYQKWGIDFVNHLEGEFSCAVWDEKAYKIILARDPYGHKPLHYYLDDQQFLFSSEIKGLIADGVKPEIDLISLSNFLSLNCIPYPATLFKNIKQVPPGSLVVFSENRLTVQPYWSPKLNVQNNFNCDEAVAQLSKRIRNAVQKRMVTPDTYCFLSGGIDSSAIISFAAELSPKPVHAISVGFQEEEKSEIEDAARMAKHVQADFHKIIAVPDSFFSMCPVSNSSFEIAGPSIIA